MITINNLVKSFGDFKVFDNLCLEIEQGEVMVILGPSGIGKSVLLKHIIGLIKPDSGEIYLDGVDITRIGEKGLNKIRRKFGMLFQSAALFDSLTVGENVAFALSQHTKLPGSVIRKIVAERLEMVGLPGIDDLYPAELSGGMKKRVGLARAIAMEPEIIMYDEPTTGLDPVMVTVIDTLTKQLQKKIDVTTIVVTHDIQSTYRIADRIAMLFQGKIEEVGTPDQIRESKNPIVRQFIEGSAEGPLTS
ncbi:MAG: ABC transporter ATP-binding protein [bacterium]|jgi:phospholipid/cholesterol/gamma-HCH transport system ATP-binding protein|nr:ABC transporter ATP-binding protein [bacterium]